MHFQRAVTFFRPHMLGEPIEVVEFAAGEPVPGVEFETVGGRVRLFKRPLPQDGNNQWRFWSRTNNGKLFPAESFITSLAGLKRKALKGTITTEGLRCQLNGSLIGPSIMGSICSDPYRGEWNFYFDFESPQANILRLMVSGRMPVGIGVDWLLDNLPPEDERKLKRVLECRESV